MTSKIVNSPLQAIHYNPYRLEDSYPFIPDKIDSLVKSISDVGFWEGVIAREHPDGSGYQLAFGHHRYEAAKEAGLKTIPLIVRNLTDKQMVEFMGRENGEDYKADFKIMLNSWDGAVTFSRQAADSMKAVDIARLLGWVRQDPTSKNGVRMNDIAQACASASNLIEEKVMVASDFEGISVKSANTISSRANTTLKEVEKKAERLNLSPEETQTQKEHVGRGAAITAKQVKEGKIPTSNLRGEVDANVFGSRKQAKVKEGPLFSKFAESFSNKLDSVLFTDASSERLHDIVDSLGMITMQADIDAVNRIDEALAEMEERIAKWRKALKSTKLVAVTEPTPSIKQITAEVA